MMTRGVVTSEGEGTVEHGRGYATAVRLLVEAANGELSTRVRGSPGAQRRSQWPVRYGENHF